MIVNRPELLISTYQEKQLDALLDIDKNMQRVSRIMDGLDNDFSDIMDNHAKSVITAINDIWTGSFTDVSRYVPYLHRETRRTADATETSAGTLEDILESQEANQQESGNLLRNIGDILGQLDIEGKVMRAIDSANTYSDIYNTIITMTGANMQEAQALRRDMVNSIDDLNSEIGNRLNPTQALQTMMAISNSTNISNRETLLEITEPILLAQETMNISLSNLATISGKLYTKYNFSSSKLERMVDTIRSSTEGQDVSEDLIVSALTNLDNSFAVYSEGDAERLEKMNLGLIKGVSFLESNYIDSQTYLNDLAEFLSPDARDNASMVKKYGSDYASRIAEAAQAGKIDEALALQNEALSNMSIYEALARGFNREDWMNSNSSYSNLGLDYLKEFEQNMDENESARENAEDKFISIGDQVTNKLDVIGSYLATMQETVGIGFTDVASMLYLYKNLGGTLGGVFGRFIGTPTAGGLTGGLGGLLTSFGPALGIGAAAAGIALIAKNIYDVVEEEYNDAGDPYQGALADTEGTYGYGWRGKYNAETGKTDWSYSAFESEEEASAYNAEEALEKYLEDTAKERSWWEKFTDSILTSGANNATLKGFGGDKFVDSVFKEDQRTTHANIEKIMSEADPGLRSLYTSKNLLTDYGELQHFAENIDKYDKYYKQGMYQGEDGQWYYIENDSLVPKGKAPKAFANGTNYVTRDQLALIHEGEAITPKQYNPAANMNELERLRAQDRESAEMAKLIDNIVAIRDLLELMHDDTKKSSTISRAKNTLARGRLSGYEPTYF